MDKKVIQISHSAANRLQSCGFSYDLHYNQKVRDKWIKPPLIFGSAFDDAINTMMSLHGEDVDILDRVYDVFETSWAKQNVNYVPTDLQTSDMILYSKYDHDFDLIDDIELEDLQAVCKKLKCNKEPIAWAREIKAELAKNEGTGLSKKMAFKKLSVNKRRFWNAFNWGCMRRRGYIMIDSFYDKVFHKIKKVHGVQKKIELQSKEGNKLIGYIDCLVEFKDKKGIYVIDIKSSRMDYLPDSVITSTQLATYCYVQENDQAGYIVVKKTPTKTTTKCCQKCGHIPERGDRHKKCFLEPEVDGKKQRCNGEYDYSFEFNAGVDIILDEIPYETQHMVMKSLDQALLDIKNKRFVRNMASCDGKFGRCIYYDMCWKQKSEKEIGLAVVKRPE